MISACLVSTRLAYIGFVLFRSILSCLSGHIFPPDHLITSFRVLYPQAKASSLTVDRVRVRFRHVGVVEPVHFRFSIVRLPHVYLPVVGKDPPNPQTQARRKERPITAVWSRFITASTCKTPLTLPLNRICTDHARQIFTSVAREPCDRPIRGL